MFDDKAGRKRLLQADLGLGLTDICWLEASESEIYSDCRQWFAYLHLEIPRWLKEIPERVLAMFSAFLPISDEPLHRLGSRHA